MGVLNTALYYTKVCLGFSFKHEKVDIPVLINGVHVGYIKAGSCTHAKNVMAAGIKKIFVKEIAIGRYKYVTEDYVETEDYNNPRIAIVVIYGPEEEAASPDPKVVKEASMKKSTG